MKLIKPIIAVFLLLTYSFAFAVELVPHCHIDNHVEYLGFEKKGSHHGHHQHVNLENKDADDVLHENHLDDNLLDFVICLLRELEHPESDILHQHIIISELTNINSKTISKTKIIAVLASIFIEPTVLITNDGINTPYLSEYQSLVFNSSPHRGPPTFSC